MCQSAPIQESSDDDRAFPAAAACIRNCLSNCVISLPHLQYVSSSRWPVGSSQVD